MCIFDRVSIWKQQLDFKMSSLDFNIQEIEPNNA